MPNNSADFPPTQYAAELIAQGHSVEEVQKIMREQHISAPTFAGVLNELMGKRKLTVDIVAGQAEIDPASIYRFMSGQRNPSRNALLRIALAMELSMDEAQKLLKSGNCSSLSITRDRDLVIMDGLINKRDFLQVNAALLAKGFPDLNGRG